VSRNASRSDRAGPCPARHAKILWRPTDGCVVLFHEDDGRAYALNETAADVWKLCDGQRTDDAIAEILARRWGRPCAAARDAVTAVLADLDGLGCLARPETAAPAAPAPPPADDAPPPSATWHEPVVEEIVFGACDCSGGSRGVIRNTQCTTTPRMQVSTV